MKQEEKTLAQAVISTFAVTILTLGVIATVVSVIDGHSLSFGIGLLAGTAVLGIALYLTTYIKTTNTDKE